MNTILTTANRRWYNIIRNCKDFKNPKTIQTLYVSLVRSVITYGSVIWRPIYKNAINRFEKLQHKAFRKIAFLSGSPIHRNCHNYVDISKKLNIPTINSFFEYSDLTFMYKIFHDDSCNSFSNLFQSSEPDYNLRSNRPFVNPMLKRNYERRNPCTRLCVAYNNFSMDKPNFANFSVQIETAKNFIRKKVFEYG